MSAQIAGASGAPTGGPPAANPLQPEREPFPRRLRRPGDGQWRSLRDTGVLETAPLAAWRNGGSGGPPDSALADFARAGDVDALDLLLRRHWLFLRRCAERTCGDAFAAEDILQDACARAAANIYRLPAGADFLLWTIGFVHNEIRGWRTKLKKVGTRGPRKDIYILESMTMEPHNGEEEDRLTILDLLAQALAAMAASARPVAAYMLRHLTAYEKLPPVRSLAAATHLSQGTAERARQDVLRCWRQKLAAEFLRG